MSAASAPKPVVSRLANNKRLQPTILSFVEKLDEKIEKMEMALEKEDMSELAGLAHWLKGAGGTVGYDNFTKPAENLETCAKADQVEMANQSLKEVKSLGYGHRTACHRYRRHCRGEIRSEPATRRLFRLGIEALPVELKIYVFVHLSI